MLCWLCQGIWAEQPALQHILDLGVRSVWYSVVWSNGLSALLLMILYFTGIWKKNRVRVS